jgi:hypothetical protein
MRDQIADDFGAMNHHKAARGLEQIGKGAQPRGKQ